MIHNCPTIHIERTFTVITNMPHSPHFNCSQQPAKNKNCFPILLEYQQFPFSRNKITTTTSKFKLPLIN